MSSLSVQMTRERWAMPTEDGTGSWSHCGQKACVHVARFAFCRDTKYSVCRSACMWPWQWTQWRGGNGWPQQASRVMMGQIGLLISCGWAGPLAQKVLDTAQGQGQAAVPFWNGRCTSRSHRQSSSPSIRSTALEAVVAGRAESEEYSLWVSQTQECGQLVAPGECMLSHTEGQKYSWGKREL